MRKNNYLLIVTLLDGLHSFCHSHFGTSCWVELEDFLQYSLVHRILALARFSEHSEVSAHDFYSPFYKYPIKTF